MSPPAWTLGEYTHTGYWWRNRGILILNICLILPLLTSSINGYDSSLVNGLQILPSWQAFFNYPSGKALGLINSAQNIGATSALPFAPFISDRFGRRVTLFSGAILMLAGVILQWTARSVPVFIGSRVIIGVGLCFSLNAAPLLITELAYPTQRGKITSLYNTAWYSGSIVSAWACFAAYSQAGSSVWSWKIPTLMQGIGPVMQACLIWFVPESPRFLVSKGLESQAAKVLAQYHAKGGDENDPLILFEMAQIRHALKVDKEISEKLTFFQLWSTPGNLKRLRIIIAIAIFSQWSGNGLVSFYINLVLEGVGITSTRTKAAINGGLQCWNLACAVTGAFLVEWVGRRPLFITSTAGMFVAFCMWTLTTALFDVLHNTAAAKATVPLIFVYYLFFDICFTPLLIAYTLEILPYGIRARGFALMNMTVQLVLAFNEFVNPWALDAIGWKYYLFYCGWLFLELLFILRYIVETRGRTLEETAALFDGEQPQQDLARMGGDAAILNIDLGRSGIPLTSRTEKSTDYYPEIVLELRPSYASESMSESQTVSRKQSQESAIVAT